MNKILKGFKNKGKKKKKAQHSFQVKSPKGPQGLVMS